jgi:hypothetical protein
MGRPTIKTPADPVGSTVRAWRSPCTLASKSIRENPRRSPREHEPHHFRIIIVAKHHATAEMTA